MIKIFIVEDEIIAAESLMIDLTQLGYEVIGKSNNGEKALLEIQKTNPDLVLMDINLKGNMDGIKLTEELAKITSIPVIYLTAYSNEEILSRAANTFPYGYIVKPYKKEDLSTTIIVALQKYKEIEKIKYQLIEQREKLNYISKFDEITELPNQLSLVENFNGILEVFYQQLSDEFTGNENEIPQLIPIFYLNFSRFKLIRDEFGQDLGNMLLKALVKRLKANLSEQTIITRLEGDDFALIIPPIETKQTAIDLAKMLLEKITPPFIYKNQEIFIDFRIGITFYPLQGQNIDELLYKAKESIKDLEKLGENQYQIYSPALHKYTPKQISLEAQLHHAIERNELELYYQPKVEFKTNKVTGAEALLRWNHPEEKFISPSIFIPLAEEIGLIDTIGEWVLNKACEQFSFLQKKYKNDLQIAVNISARQFNQDLLEHKLLKIMSYHYFNPNLLELELTESLLVNNANTVAKKLNKLKSLGFKIAIDDFGTGYSSLGYMQNFNFDTLKIDRCFIKDIQINPKNATITKSLIDMAHQLNLNVVAEGVEIEPELAFLHKNNCDFYQGYLFSRPLPFRQFEELLINNI
ncbi:diguanylate cyclase/phosphodiesterase with PAS/PAC sensor [Geminocystis sp. NIES-3708]|uniref:two-component system response regulator n=1 Tax=Geminocystis sp. NIES-3708 TaxID=1615909 RepID=UPI0005FCA697|nr:EAL domain-containing protein [Geminocystis sp. NIES-3708]BAQ61316.1 diguanylate cyclase/phosphodiesterase with PAS/PAC sensor [Geminocystis sp. NIES-3708]